VTTARALRAAEHAHAAVQRAGQHADSFDNAPPRRPLHGHTADCPNRLHGPARRCGPCRAEALGHDNPLRRSQALWGTPTHPEVPTPPRTAPSDHHEAPLAACRRCYAPTTTPEEHCT
jgi:hypothetical protein